MKTYENPVISQKTCSFINAAGQYVFEFTPEACPGLTLGSLTAAGQEGGIKQCFQGPPVLPGNFDAEITCRNISGTFNIHVSSGVDLGDNCFFLPITSITPELPADCIVDTFVVEGQFDDCNTPS